MPPPRWGPRYSTKYRFNYEAGEGEDLDSDSHDHTRAVLAP